MSGLEFRPHEDYPDEIIYIFAEGNDHIAQFKRVMRTKQWALMDSVFIENTDELRQILSKLDELNGTTQPSLLERVRDKIVKRIVKCNEVIRDTKDIQVIQYLETRKESYKTIIDDMEDNFPELKDLSAGEQ